MQANIDEVFCDEAIKMILNISHLYRVFASIHYVDRKIWLEMAQQQEAHASMIKLLASRFSEAASIMINTLNLERLNSINSRISAYVEQIELDGIGRKEAFNVALQLEHQIYENSFRKILHGFNVLGIKDIFVVMAQRDREHNMKFKRYVQQNC